MDSSVNLPFNSINDLQLNDIFALNTNSYSLLTLNQLNFNPLNIITDKYNNGNDVDSFLAQSRDLNCFESNYVYLDSYPLPFYTCDCLTIVTFNIRGLAANLQKFNDEILETSLTCDIIGMTETKLESSFTHLYNVNNYNLFTQNRNRDGGGVCVYVCESHSGSLIPELCFTEPYLECVAVKVNIRGEICLAACLYRPPKGNISLFFDKLEQLFDHINEKNFGNVHLFGDWNLDLLKHSHDSNIPKFINLMTSNSFISLTTKPTRVTDSSATLIDHIWTSCPELNIGNYIVYSHLTDHFPVVSQFKLKSKLASANYSYKRIVNIKGLTKFTSELNTASFDDVMASQCPNAAYNKFHSIIDHLFQKHFPIRKINTVKQDKSPYITPALRASIKEKHRLERLAHLWPLTYRTHFNKYRNMLTSLLRTAKNNYYKNLLNTTQGDARTHWRTINTIMGKLRNSQEVINLSTTNDVCNAFNNHFLNVSSNTDLPDDDTNYLQYLRHSPHFSLYLRPVTTSECESCIKNLKSSSPGYDEIPPKILKHSVNYLVKPLTHIINLIIRTGIFPDNMKIAKVIPLFKSGSKDNVNNYRPISILPVFSKIVEKTLSVRLIDFLEKNNLLVNSQHGFRKDRSTDTALLDFTQYVYRCLEDKINVVGLFLDLSKAFDSLSHHILVDKLKYIGIRGPPLKLFTNYLANRKQVVHCNNNKSDIKNISKGVPQGSILGPILFLIYINDIVHASSKFKFILFADDTNLLLSDNDLHVLHSNLSTEMGHISQWLRFNKLNLNITKSNYILFQNHTLRNTMPPLYFNGQTISNVKHTKFLGINIDEHLNWKYHIAVVCDKLSKSCGILYKIRNLLTKEALISIYYTICYPHLIYGLSIWGCTWPSYLQSVYVAQKKILRCILFKGKYDSVDGEFETLNMLKFKYLHKYFLVVFLYKNLFIHSNKHFSFLNLPQHTRRSNIDLVCPEFRTTLVKNSIVCFGPQLWNSLPRDLKQLSLSCNLNTYRFKIKKHFLAMQITT